MGYTHNWTVTRDFTDKEWSEITTRFNHLLANLPPYFEETNHGFYKDIPLVLGDAFGEGDPVVNGQEIVFNGTANIKKYNEYLKREDTMSHETFWLSKTRQKWNFCKTARKPYDLVVCVTLLIACHVAPDAIATQSDGDEDDWQPAKRLYEKLWE